MANTKELFEHLFNISAFERGKIFELYCKWFLENDPVYSAQIKKVWLWKDWPGNWGRDKGIDLIAETRTGEFWAIQSKCYDKSYYVTKEDVDKFLSESSRSVISYRLLICTTDRLGDNAREVITAQEKQVGLCSLENLLESSLEWPSSIENLQPLSVRRPKTPRPHQEMAIASVLEGFKSHDKGQLYMACGTGKTLVGLWVAEALKSQNTLVLVPSISLVSQLYQEWIANAATNFIPIFVCSDPTVGNKDQMVTSLYELGFPTTTDPKALLNYLSSTVGTPKVIFSTYHSSPVIKELCTLDKRLTFDIIIADEAHRCAGAANSDFATLFETDAIRTRRKLFMTATPKIFSNHVKTKAQEFEYDILSMDNEEKFGPVFHKLPFSTAIAQDLLSDYEVLISIMDDKTYREYAEKGRFVAVNRHESDARTIATQLLMSKAIKNYDLRRIITFHNRKSAADEFISSFPIALNLVSEEQKPTIGFYGMILGDMLQSKRKSILKLFENVETGSSAVLANVRCLSEGIDVPTLDGVAFIDPKGSEIEIVQAIGRAIRKAPNKKRGLIILPVFIDANDNPDINLEASCFKPIWKVLNALRAHDDILAEELDHLRLELGRRTYKKPPKLNKIMIDLPVSIDSAFSESLRLKILENTTASWFYYFGLLEKFKEENCHCNVPDDYPVNPSFGNWVQNQRSKKNLLSKEHIRMLDELGFDWDPRDSAWNFTYTNLIKFKEENGHCNVPVDYSIDPFLGRWVNTQRTKKNELPEDRIQKLDLIGFDWDRSESVWNEMYANLVKFKEVVGHCNVPKDYPENPKLGMWVSTQRLKTTKMTSIRIEKLDKLGFCWNILDASWNHYFDKLVQFKKKNGHCNIPIDYPEDPSFAFWINRQRTKKAKFSKERIARLDELGFDWDPRESDWNQQYELLTEFHMQNGHCNISRNHPHHSSLARWTQTQRINKNKLSPERKEKLNKLEFVWDLKNPKTSSTTKQSINH